MDRINKRRVISIRLTAILALVFLPAIAYAEPSADGAHRPILWALSLLGAAVFGSIPFIVKKIVKPDWPGWIFWVSSAVLAFLFLIFIAPIVVVMGSILISGRTM